MKKPITETEDCLDLAYEQLKQSGAQVNDSDVESLASSIRQAIDDWFGDMKHLQPKEIVRHGA